MVNVTDNELENFYYDYETFDSLEDKLAMKDEYFCESQGYENEYEIKCPLYYHIVIDKSFYGRYARDLKHCTEGNDGEKIPKSNLLRIKNMVTKCGSDYTSYFKESCDGHENCRIFPSLSEFRDSCTDIYKYVHIKYHCEKDEEIKKPKFAIAMFANKIESNSIYENAISEFYQYTDIHNYKFFLNRVKYDNERSTFYMKINTLIEVVIQGLKTKACDWVLWVDGDVVLTNPNIKLEAFVPTDNDIHMLFGVDKNGFNAGVILMRVHSWTLNILMRAKSYQYYNKDRDLYYVDQSALNNVLVTDHEERHYMIIPKNWFNKYNFNEVQLVQRDLFNKNKVSLEPSDFIYHFAGLGDIKDKKANQLRNKVYNILYNDPNWSKEFTNKKLREEVLEYYENNKDVNNRQRLKLQN
ncbi:hypothetical protein BCR36DRAFT_585606 [Piromyces finnis]|uniref:SUEL-type lectin domain-containing protein n=1 Tax=Piromyces finnis TaxID=1754191 RepID=A0A1Y1V354_9FUNG|nr:hypothetical protein BCR36DRAFT_585606 [Piromyces finnis]|eukprot:ORX45581.1 hypothetical protein BCR36DRAFT_585606 [Piromyces finnis]